MESIMSGECKMSNKNRSGIVEIWAVLGLTVLIGVSSLYIQKTASREINTSMILMNQLEGFHSSEIAAWQNYYLGQANAYPASTSSSRRRPSILKNDYTDSICTGKCPNLGTTLPTGVGTPISLKQILNSGSNPDPFPSLVRRYTASTLEYVVPAATTTGNVKLCGTTKFNVNQPGVKTCLSSNSVPVVPTPTLPPLVTSICEGINQGCAVVGGALQCWGDVYYEPLSTGTPSGGDTKVPITMFGFSKNVTAMGTGQHTTCVVVDGGLQCWGGSYWGQQGNGSIAQSFAPAPVVGLSSGVSTVTVGVLHVCALVNGSAKCWGDTGAGALGNGVKSGAYTYSTVPAQVSGLTANVTAISANYSSSCAIVNGAVKCWGILAYNTVADMAAAPQSAVPVQVPGLTSGVTAISKGNEWSNHNCVVVNGAVKCWGNNASGQLGNGTKTDSLTPVQVNGLTSGATAVGTTQLYSCALVNGGVKCWGSNLYRQMGSSVGYGGTTVPVSIPGLSSGVTALSTGENALCAIVNGATQCMGANDWNQLGNGSTKVFGSTPLGTVKGLTHSITGISGGIGYGCRILNGGAQCWGDNSKGLLGNGSYVTPSVNSYSKPIQVSGLASGVTDISASEEHACAVLSGNVWCWGDNTYGQLGTGNATASNIPVQVSGLSSVSKVSVGLNYTCALKDGGVFCWGYNGTGALGTGDFSHRFSPTQVLVSAGVPLASASEIRTAGSGTWGNSCAIVDGGVYCWGGNYWGQLGFGGWWNGATSHPYAVAIAGLTGVSDLSVNSNHVCVASNGEAKCWGGNLNGEIGNGTIPASTGQGIRIPTKVLGSTGVPLIGVTKVAAGFNRSCASVNGTLQCWGGGASKASVATPTDVINTGITSLVTVGGESAGFCAMGNGQMGCW